MLYSLCCYFLTFCIYSLAGWVLETLLYLIRDKKVVKRGFLFGPFCPIYGSAAVICTLVLYGRVDNYGLIFLYGLLLCGGLEYITHFVLEKLFHAMWWDYSDRRFNIKGRVYFNGLLYFGVGAIAIIKLIQPALYSLFHIIPENGIYIASLVIYTVLVVDISTTIADLKQSAAMLKKLLNSGIENSQQAVDDFDKRLADLSKRIQSSPLYSEIKASLNSESSALTRIRRKNPNFGLKKYKPILDIILDKPIKEKKRKDLKLHGDDNDFSEDK